jgi:CelD/BcsL family acetyltransferase involved in cellulose biosynthesis
MYAALVPFSAVRHDPETWKRWAALASDAPPFLSPEFFALNAPLIAGGEPMIAASWSADRLTGVLPLIRSDHTLRAMRGSHSPGFDYCGTRAGIAAIWMALRDDHRWSELVIDKVPSDSILVQVLPDLARADRCPVVVRPTARHPYFDLPGFEARMKPKFRTNVLRCLRKAGDVTFERIEVPDHAALDEAASLEAMAWKAAAGSNIDADPRVRHLYDAVSRVLGRRHRASLAFLRVGGRRIAALFAVEDDRTLYALKIGYDPAHAAISPGHLLVYKAALDAEQRGLRVFDFVGREDEWKRKWTDLAHEDVCIQVYRNSPRGLVRYTLRELIKPHVPATVRETPRSPFPRGCQHADRLGDHTLYARIADRVGRGFGIRRRLRNIGKVPTARPRLGQPSVFAVGTYVRVRDEAAIRATLDGDDRLRGLQVVPAQWSTCGLVFRVAAHVQRIRDDHGRYRAVARTVLLEDVDCSYGARGPGGCGRHCPLMYRDEWLEPAAPRPTVASPIAPVRYARVRDIDEIYAGLDPFGRRDGITFMPEMAALAGRRLPIAGTLDRVFECDAWVSPRAAIYMLEGVHCTGAVCGEERCDRACTLMWHEDWLVIESPR